MFEIKLLYNLNYCDIDYKKWKDIILLYLNHD